jgi:cell division protein FtsX
VELEQEHGAQAPSLPEYQMVEQLLLRKGAFEEGQQQHLEHAEEVEEVQEERITTARTTGNLRILALIAIVALVLALLLIAAAILIR